MKKFMTFILAAVMCLPLMADAYRDALLHYLKVSNTVNPGTTEAFSQSIEQLAESAFADDPQLGKKIVSEYIETQLMEDMTDIFLPAYRKYVSESDIKQLENMYNDPHFAQIQKKSIDIASNLQDKPEFSEFMTQYQQAIQVIMQDGTPEDLQRPVSVSGEYARVFNDYYVNSGTKEIINSSFRQVMDVLQNMFKEQGIGDQKTKQLLTRVQQYTDKNMPVMLMSIFNKEITLRDLQYLTEIITREPNQHAIRASLEMTSDLMGLVLQIMEGMDKWVNVHYPQHGKTFDELIKQTRALLNR